MKTNSPTSAPASDRVWPLVITFGLILVVLVNVAFIVIAVVGADPVAESYEAGER